jgi:hypothetical protein
VQRATKEDRQMDESVPPVPIPLRPDQVVAYIEEQGALSLASRVIELLLAAGGPQERFATVANHIAENLAFTASVAAEVRAFGKAVASLSPSSFARLQDLAWSDCRDGVEVAMDANSDVGTAADFHDPARLSASSARVAVVGEGLATD